MLVEAQAVDTSALEREHRRRHPPEPHQCAPPISVALARRSGGDGHFGAALQVELVTACDDDRPGAAAGAYHRPDGGALPAARDRADDGAEGGADRAPLHRFLRLAVCGFDLAFVIDPDRLSISACAYFR